MFSLVNMQRIYAEYAASEDEGQQEIATVLQELSGEFRGELPCGMNHDPEPEWLGLKHFPCPRCRAQV